MSADEQQPPTEPPVLDYRTAGPSDTKWNLEGVENNAVQRVAVVVGAPDQRQAPADGD